MVFEQLRAWVVGATTLALGQETDATKVVGLKMTLATLYEGQGKYDQAEPLFVACLATRKEVLGDRHPDTLALIDNLVVLLKKLGRDDDAMKLQQSS